MPIRIVASRIVPLVQLMYSLDTARGLRDRRRRGRGGRRRRHCHRWRGRRSRRVGASGRGLREQRRQKQEGDQVHADMVVRGDQPSGLRMSWEMYSMSMALRNPASTRLITMMARKLTTKASVVARPTPAAPGRQLKPL